MSRKSKPSWSGISARVYQAILVRAVRNYRRAAVIAAVFLVLCLSLGLRLGTEFLPKLEEGNLWIRAVMPPTITLEAGMETVAKIRAIISSYPPVQTVFSEQGRGEEGTDPDGSFLAEFFVPLKPADTWPPGLTKEQMVKQMSEQLNREFVGIDFNFSQYIQDNIEEAVSGVKGENSIKIFGKDLNELERLVQVGEDRTLGRARRRRSRQLQSARPAQSGRSGSIAPRPRATASRSATSIRWCRPRSAARKFPRSMKAR